MITYVTALYPEAKYIIDTLELKQNPAEHHLQLFEGNGIRLVITGAGAISAATAISRYYTLHPPTDTDLLINVGIAGYTAGTMAACESRHAIAPKLGELFLVSGITEQTTRKTFYPDLLFRHSFSLLPLTTCPVPAKDDAAFYAETLVDMEAAAIYQAALPYLSAERMFFFKVISDRIGRDKIRDLKNTPEQLISPWFSDVHAFAVRTEQLLSTEASYHNISTSLEENDLIIAILARLPFTESMSREFQRLIAYARLAGIALTPLLKDFLETLPENIRGKKQAVPHLAELKKRILATPGNLLSAETARDGYLPPFSMLYAEEGLDTDIFPEISEEVPVRIHHYKDLFNRSHQNFARQKKSPALILAKKTGTLIYPGAPVCQSFGNQHFYYTSCMMNCIYHCDYCYLQGMYPSGHVVVFVNLEDYFKEVELLLTKHPVYLCVSYDTDLLALEKRFSYVTKWLLCAKEHPDLTLEIRTKSGNPAVFSELAALYDDSSSHRKKNIIFAWTVSPKQVCSATEHGAASLPLRQKALLAAADAGFSVRLCFDPMICHGGWQENYRELVTQIFTTISPDILYDVSIGVFRISTEYLKNMRKKRPDSAIVQYPYITENGVSHYGSLSEEMVHYLENLLLEYLPADKIFIWNGGL